MRLVNDLSMEELEELRESYFYQLQDQGEEDFENPEDIPMSNVMFHYEGVMFSEDDFFINLNTTANEESD